MSKNMWLRPLLGLISGCILYYLCILYQQTLTGPQVLPLAIGLTFPLFGLQIKLPYKKWGAGLLILILMGIMYGLIMHHLMTHFSDPINFLNSVLASQCGISAFILFIFYCVFVEEQRGSFPYLTLFNQAWQVILKVILAKLLILLALGLFYLASMLFEQLNILIIKEIVLSMAFFYIMPTFLFGVAMTILDQHEDIMIKLRNIVLAFSRFLYPISVVISLCFLLAIPFAQKPFGEFWELTVFINLVNVVLFNGIYQAGLEHRPYPKWFCAFIYILLVLNLGYSVYILQFPWSSIMLHKEPIGILLLISLLFLTLYNASYVLALFFSKKPWLSLVKACNTILALLLATTYVVLAVLPWSTLIA